MADDIVAQRDLDEPQPDCTCGGYATPYGDGHTGDCAIMQWHELQTIMHLRVERGKLKKELREAAAEIERLREALRTAQIIYLGNQGVCRACGAGWTGRPELHKPGCLAALSAQGQQEPTGDSSDDTRN